MSRRGKDGELLIPFLQVLTDIIAVEGAFFISYWLRFHSPLTELVPVTRGIPPLDVYAVSSLFVTALMIILLERNSLYGVRRNSSRTDELGGIFRSVTTGMLIIAAATFFYREFSYSRLVFILIWLACIVLLATARFAIIDLERYRHRKGRGIKRAAVVGSGYGSRDVHGALAEQPGLGMDLVGFIGENPHLDPVLERLGPLDDIPGIIASQRLDVIFIAFGGDEESRLFDMIDRCAGLDVEFFLVPDVLEMMTSRLRVEEIGGIPLLKIKDAAITGWRLVFKRTFDLLFSAAALILLSPLFALLALGVALSSKGPVFYRQERIGRDGRRFFLVKFRSMYRDAESGTGPVWTVKDDSRVTPFGRLLRRFSLDELPQLVNVFRGEMSLVGPRPERPHFVDRFQREVPKYLERHRVKSGMTGWAQVNGLRGNVPIGKRTKYDIYYVENWSFYFDIKIILMTIWTVLAGKDSY